MIRFIKPSLKKNLFVSKSYNENIIFASHPLKDAINFESMGSIHKEIFLLLDGELSITEIHNYLVCKKYDVSIEELEEFINELDELELIEESQVFHSNIISESDMDRYNRQMLLFSSLPNNNIEKAIAIQEKIIESHVCIIGAGGTGSHFIYGLASMGIGALTIVDFDNVEESNLSRQMFYCKEDIGRSKINVLKEKCPLINDKTKYNYINKRIVTEDDIMEVVPNNCDLVILCADTPRGKIQFMLNKVCHRLNKALLCCAATSSDVATVGPIVIPGSTACLHCTLNKEDNTIIDNEDTFVENLNNRFTTMVIEPYNALVANLGVLESIKHLTGFSKCNLYNKMIQFNMDNLISIHTDINKNKNCIVCGEKCR